MGWTMLYLFVFLKLPILAACYIVWWAIHQTGDETEVPSDGGSPVPRRPHPRRPFKPGPPRPAPPPPASAVHPGPPPPWRTGVRRPPPAPAAHPLGDGRRPRPRAA